nr:trypsin 5G1-like [Osmia lignaria]
MYSSLLMIFGFSVLCTASGYGNYQKRIVPMQEQDSPGSRIIGGAQAGIEEYPFAVSLQNNGTFFGHEVEHFCGGSIIGEKWIITSAQCALRIRVKGFHVRAGTSYYYENGEIFRVKSVTIHPAFNENIYDYDVGLIELADSIKYDNMKQSIKLPQSHSMIEDGVQVQVLGWGASRLLGPVSEELLRSTMQKINNENCQQASGGDILTNRMFCALSNGAGPCVGDSGSPLIFENMLFGITSWSRSCSSKYPTAFTATSEVKDWITEVTGIA